MEDVLERTIDLRCSLTHAFRVFTRMTNLWWPKTHRKDSASTLVLEAKVNGRLFERSANGDEWTIGEVTEITPPRVLRFNWYPGSPNAPTAVDVRFEGDDTSARIIIVHRAISGAAAEVWPEKVALFARGWDIILPAYADFCQTEL